MITHANCEANICHHCNNRCASCNHLAPFAPPYFMPPSVLKRDLVLLANLIHFGFFCLQGGEPLLHPAINDLIDIACDSGIADSYGMLSNGKMLAYMPDSFWRKCAQRRFQIRVTIYPNLTIEALYAAEAKSKQFGAEFRPGPLPNNLFMSMLHPNDGSSYYGCAWRECWTIHEGHFFVCPIAPFMAPQFLLLPMETDGLKLTEKTTEQDILNFYHQDKPLKSCHLCCGTRGKGVPWHQCSTLEEWIKDSTL